MKKAILFVIVLSLCYSFGWATGDGILFKAVGTVKQAYAGEQLDLSTPVICNGYRVQQLYLDFANSIININLICIDTGEIKMFAYTGSVASGLMIGLNKANLSTSSLHKRILERLVSDGKLTGTVSGIPD